MKQLLCIALSIISFVSSFGQKLEIEALVSKASKEIVPVNFKYYNLIDTSSKLKFDKYSFERDEIKFFLMKNPDFPVDSFLQKQAENPTVDWNKYQIDRARVYSYSTISKSESHFKINKVVPFDISKRELDSLNRAKKYYEMVIPVKQHWSKRKIGKKFKQAWATYESSLKPENKTYFSFSSPIICGNYAIISLNQSLRGATYIFKKINNNWTKVLVFESWTS